MGIDSTDTLFRELFEGQPRATGPPNQTVPEATGSGFGGPTATTTFLQSGSVVEVSQPTGIHYTGCPEIMCTKFQGRFYMKN